MNRSLPFWVSLLRSYPAQSKLNRALSLQFDRLGSNPTVTEWFSLSSLDKEVGSDMIDAMI